MKKEEALMLINELLSDSDKVSKCEAITPLRKAFHIAKSTLEDNMKYQFSEEEINQVMNAIISSCVDTTNDLQDRVLNLMNLHLVN